MNESPAVLTAGDARDHALRMDRMYRYQRHIYDLTRKYYLLGRDHMIARLGIPSGGSLLEVGCGTGRNMVLARRHHPTAMLYGLDISAEMLATARAKFAGERVPPRFEVGDATAFTAADFGQTGFDRVMISYALSMIPDWPAAIDRAIAALGPEGALHIVDFGQQERLPRAFRTGLQAWLTRFHVTPRPDLRAVLEERATANALKLTFEPLWRGYAWHAVLAR
ncbi:S-adenosylmethionine-diacylgycerolhomoserine-N-methyltransferase [Peteryoungia aggregata LMG 23059]|uniref:S-adenosylmethionine-diacylgycerolhomoserine-N-methyltransferase n=1 Tax=Peteryoungia aggregata LMG 23059 TaxID=1368425 RepID=A0ABU0G9G0_9HYPH|nr:class I SAM-dependent methyltransferase [Peteryoungia aggregata]MDQ0421282.1 S-adenosylmethionine-diacylgycerolhomoserine-N-methyltransferase [Peteryoungia aggregata LMG 23059]